MKEFAYYPGCSLEKIALSYHLSTMETTKKLGIKLNELEDWNCCGATTYFHVDELLAYTLVARNLAMAEKQGLDVVAPCSACYKNMYFTREHLNDEPDLADHINFALEEDNLQFAGSSKVKHLPLIEDGKIVGIVTMRQLLKLRYPEPLTLIEGIREAGDVATLKAIKSKLPRMAEERLESGRTAYDIVVMISLINRDIHRRSIGNGAQPASECD